MSAVLEIVFFSKKNIGVFFPLLWPHYFKFHFWKIWPQESEDFSNSNNENPQILHSSNFVYFLIW